MKPHRNNCHHPLLVVKKNSLAPVFAGVVLLLTPSLNLLQAQDPAPVTPPAGAQTGRGPGGPGGPGGTGGRNFDPAQMRQRMMDRYREQLTVKDDTEWKVIGDRITKINELRLATGGRGFGGFGGRGPGGAGGGADAQGGRQGRGNGAGFGGQPNPGAEALQAALDSGASTEDIKVKLAAYRASIKENEAKLEQAQDELRQLLSVKQEATAVLIGLLK